MFVGLSAEETAEIVGSTPGAVRVAQHRALSQLRKAGVREVSGFAGFPVSGLWLRAKNPELVKQHHAKVYGKAAGAERRAPHQLRL